MDFQAPAEILCCADAADKQKLGRAFEEICRDINLGNMVVGNRSAEMDMTFDKDLKLITTDRCIPFDVGPISHKCDQDLKAIFLHRSQISPKPGKVRKQTTEARSYINTALYSDKMPQELGVALASKIVWWNKVFCQFRLFEAQ